MKYRVGPVQRVDLECDQCSLSQRTTPTRDGLLVCGQCDRVWQLASSEQVLNKCAICGCTRFFAQKDFNRGVGCVVMLAGAVLVPVTYGVSLPVCALVDWLLYRKVPDMAVCYLCQAEYRGFAMPQRLMAYRHHMAEGFEKRRTQRRQERTPPQ